MMSVTRWQYIFYAFSGLLVAASIFGLAAWGLHLGIDFTGGSSLEITYKQVRPPVTTVVEALKDLKLVIAAQPVGDTAMALRFPTVDEATHQRMLALLGGSDKLTEDHFESIGPTISGELVRKSIWAILLVVIAIALYITWAFRKVAGTVPPWHYGVITLITLFHDVIITLGSFAFLSHFTDAEVNAPFIAAILTILGFSVHDTIVVFDRIRENITRLAEKDFSKIVDSSVRQTLTRSFNTSFTVLITLLAIFFFGGSSLHYFVVVLIVGIAIGTYSSIFLASPLLARTAGRQKH